MATHRAGVSRGGSMRRRKKNSYAKPDTYTRAAKDAGYAARSVYKRDTASVSCVQARSEVLDLGCARGRAMRAGWPPRHDRWRRH